MTDAASHPTAPPVAVENVSPIDHAEATGLARHHYDRLASAFEGVGGDAWSNDTDCEGWTVRDLGGHVVGAMRAAASVSENTSQLVASLRRSKRSGRPVVDELTALQIERTAELSVAELVDEMRRLVEPAATGRRRTPSIVRRFGKMAVEVPGLTETWTVGYLVDTILTRDTLMHRIDLARAVDCPLVLDAEADRRVIADIAREWTVRHGSPVRLTLSGQGGLDLVAGDGGEHLILDAVEFCRIVSGRAPGEGLLAQAVPF